MGTPSSGRPNAWRVHSLLEIHVECTASGPAAALSQKGHCALVSVCMP
eukprot:NODE_9227_length_326_cov_44.732852_g7461_i0.p3 GENE.NODE_9227_length_326_cov_44.732852_g7461_i0~~NODE_9227_length_326_cov_44.732852_g7461_i0.p3  ORF type:complete len:58 (+),score=14.59 NODE_9227_length_326_cov_44.732852_g7461_i0:32-175(+)